MSLSRQSIAGFLEREFELDLTHIEGETPLYSSGLIDSFDLVSLIGFIELQCGVEIEPQDIDLEHLDSIDRILAFAAARAAG